MNCKPMTRKEWAASVDEMWKSAVEFAYKDLIDEAIKAEREECAKVVENSLVKQNVKYSINNINEKDVEKIYKLQCELSAAAIRARGEGEKND